MSDADTVARDVAAVAASPSLWVAAGTTTAAGRCRACATRVPPHRRFCSTQCRERHERIYHKLLRGSK